MNITCSVVVFLRVFRCALSRNVTDLRAVPRVLDLVSWFGLCYLNATGTGDFTSDSENTFHDNPRMYGIITIYFVVFLLEVLSFLCLAILMCIFLYNILHLLFPSSSSEALSQTVVRGGFGRKGITQTVSDTARMKNNTPIYVCAKTAFIG
jgi:hypothetical protein